MASKHLWATALTDTSTTAQEELGAVRKEWSSTDSCFKTFKYVQNSTVTTIADGTALTFRNILGTIVTGDISTSKVNLPAGVGIGALAASSYGWIQVGGYHSVILTNGDDDIARGDSLIVDTADGVVDSVANGSATTSKVIGIAVTDDVNGDNTVAGLIDCLYGDIVQ